MIVDGGRGGVRGMLALPMCAGCVVVDGGGGGGVHCGGDVLVMFSLWFALSAVHNNKKN